MGCNVFVTDADTAFVKDPFKYLIPNRVCDFQMQGDNKVSIVFHIVLLV